MGSRTQKLQSKVNQLRIRLKFQQIPIHCPVTYYINQHFINR